MIHTDVLKPDLWRYCRICDKPLKSGQKSYCGDEHRLEGNLIETTIREIVDDVYDSVTTPLREEAKRFIREERTHEREKKKRRNIEKQKAEIWKELSRLAELKKTALEEGNYPAVERIGKESRELWLDKDNPLRPKRTYGKRQSIRPIPTEIKCPDCGSANLKRTPEIVCIDCGACLGHEYGEWIPFDIVNQRKDSAVIKIKEEKDFRPL